MSLVSFWRTLSLLFAQITLFTNAITNYTCPYNTIGCFLSCDTYSNCPIAIDATTSVYFELNCYESRCKNRIIKCPISGGCLINCNGDFSCQGTRIEYDGSVNNYGNISVNCIGTAYTCNYMTINAEYIEKIAINCTSSSTSSAYGPCSLTLNANFANNVTIFANEKYASYRDTWNVQSAKYVVLNARGGGI